MAKQSKPKCKFCGAFMEKKLAACPACGLSKDMDLVQCAQCGVKFGVDPRDTSAKLCPGCYRKKSNKRILIKLGVIAAFMAALVVYKAFQSLIH